MSQLSTIAVVGATTWRVDFARTLAQGLGLAGNSLPVIKLVALIRNNFGAELTLGEVFDHSGVASLSALLVNWHRA